MLQGANTEALSRAAVTLGCTADIPHCQYPVDLLTFSYSLLFSAGQPICTIAEAGDVGYP